jgi:hypothetical protein
LEKAVCFLCKEAFKFHSSIALGSFLHRHASNVLLQTSSRRFVIKLDKKNPLLSSKNKLKRWRTSPSPIEENKPIIEFNAYLMHPSHICYYFHKRQITREQ